MKPITRKELYLNKIVGNNDYEIPEKPITTEEFFFAEILGEAVQAPEPLTRYQMYLAKIAGRNIETPYPETRLEYFLAKAAGMDISTPVPITKEEIYWSNYTAIVEFEFEGVPPLTYKAIEGTLKNYRIYGNTFDGESVGDLVESGEHAGEYKVPVMVEGKNLLLNTAASQTISGVTFTVNSDRSVTCNGTANGAVLYEIYSFPRFSGECILSGCPMGGSQNTYRLQYTNLYNLSYEDYGTGVNIYQFDEMQYPTSKINIRIESGYTCNNLTFYPMIRKANIEDDTYEPYHAPVTVPIYLPEPIKMVGDEAEYIDYGEQKFVKKFYKITLNFDDMNNDETFPGWSGGAAVVEYCNKIRSLAIHTPDGYMPLQYSSISNFKVIVNVRNNRSILFLGASLDIGHTQSELKEIYAGRSITFILKIPDTELDVTLPALPTLPGTNVLSVGTEVQPSHVFVEFYKEREYG